MANINPSWFDSWPAEGFTFYLAHASASRQLVRAWELKFESHHPGISLINPFYDVGGPGGREDVVFADAGNLAAIPHHDPTAVVERDLETLKRCRGILAILDNSFTIGAPQEIVYAHQYKKEPRLAVCTNGLHGNPWLRHHTQQVYSSLDELDRNVEFIVEAVRRKD